MEKADMKNWKSELVARVKAARDPAPAPAPAPAFATIAAAPAAAPVPQATDYSALWARVIQREAAGVIAQRRAMGFE
jgi:hypothetical protein